jgi:hypothetical protein
VYELTLVSFFLCLSALEIPWVLIFYVLKTWWCWVYFPRLDSGGGGGVEWVQQVCLARERVGGSGSATDAWRKDVLVHGWVDCGDSDWDLSGGVFNYCEVERLKRARRGEVFGWNLTGLGFHQSWVERLHRWCSSIPVIKTRGQDYGERIKASSD